jgi:branched-chain amino acid transport system permease protein
VTFAGAALEKYRLLAVVFGLALFVAMRLVLKRTKIGLIVRAGVQNGEMVEALGYNCGWSSSASSSPALRWPGWAA